MEPHVVAIAGATLVLDKSIVIMVEVIEVAVYSNLNTMTQSFSLLISF